MKLNYNVTGEDRKQTLIKKALPGRPDPDAGENPVGTAGDNHKGT